MDNNPSRQPAALASSSGSFNYYPWTNWERFCEGWFSTQYFIGNNVEEKGIENYVLNTVGSYGKQINLINNALEFLIKHHTTKEDQKDDAITKFLELATQASTASKEFKSNGISDTEFRWWLDSLKSDNPELYAGLTATIRNSLKNAWAGRQPGS
jgi:hypothetical protein